MKSVAICLISLLVLVSVASAEVPTVSGQVRLVDGAAVVGASVVLFDVSEARLGMLATTTTDASGQFALGGAAGVAQPMHFSLGQSYPNPFNPTTIIPYELTRTARVRLEVFNLLGQRVVTLVDAEQAAGSYAVRWDARDGLGYGVASGVYIYRLTAGEGLATGRMVLVDGSAGAALPGRSLGHGVASDGMEVPAGPVGPVESQFEASVYGLAVWGDGIETYVDTAFVLGSGPVEVVLDEVVGPRGKAVAAPVGWQFTEYDLLNAENRAYWQGEANDMFRNNCSEASGDVVFAAHDGFLVYEMSLPKYDCFSGVAADSWKATKEALINIAQDVVIIIITAKATLKAIAGAVPSGGASFVLAAAVIAKVLKNFSAFSDAKFLLSSSRSIVEGYVSSTRVGLLGNATDQGHLVPGPQNVPLLMVRHEKDAARRVELELVKEYGLGNDECQHLGSLNLRPNRGYFIIPAQQFSLHAWGDPLSEREVRFELELESEDGIFYERDLTFTLARGNYYQPRFTAVRSGDEVVLDASLSTILPFANGDDYPEATYHWGYNNNTEFWYRSLGSGEQLRVPLSSFEELVAGRGTVEIQLDVSRWDVTTTERQKVVLGEPEAEELIEPEVPGDLVTGTERSFSLPGGGEMEFVWIEPGTFMMGSPSEEWRRDSDEGPVHEVEISMGFYLGKYEVTQGAWEAVMETTPWSGERHVCEYPSKPAVYISWEDVQAFVEKLNDAAGSDVYRLPTEAEWEYAC